MSPASGDSMSHYTTKELRKWVSIQLMSPASGDGLILKPLNKDTIYKFPFN